MVKLQTTVSKVHNRLNNVLLDAHDIDASVNRKIRKAEMLMKKLKKKYTENSLRFTGDLTK